jgi:hypothetical protein
MMSLSVHATDMLIALGIMLCLLTLGVCIGEDKQETQDEG